MRPRPRASGPKLVRTRLALVALSCAAVAPASGQAVSTATADTGARADSTSLAAAARARAASRGASVAVIDVREVDLATIHTLPELLAARVPGVMVRRTSGAAGVGSAVWMRGPWSDPVTTGPLARPRGPMLVVDGVRADATQHSLLLDDDADATSRLDDFRLEDLATVEVLRGPAAAARYGVGAERGVIVLTTRRGQAGAPHLGVVAQSGASSNPARFAPLYGRQNTLTGTMGCSLDAQSLGTCVPGPLVRRDVAVGSGVYRQAAEARLGAHVQGVTWERLRYYLGAGHESQPGISDLNDDRRTSVRARLDAALPRGLGLSATAGRIDRRTDLPPAGGTVLDPLTRALRTTADGTPPTLTGLYAGYAMPFDVRQDVTRLTAGASLRWRPVRWLAAGASYGGDDARRDETTPDLPSYGPTTSFYRAGNARVRGSTVTADVEGSYRLGPLDAVTAVGTERTLREASTYDFIGLRQSPDAPRVPTGAFTSTWSRSRLVGSYATQRLAWRDRLVANGGVRRDREAVLDVPLGTQPFADVAWALGGRPRGAARLWANEARLRAAYGVVSIARGTGFLPGGGYGDYVGLPPSPPPRPKPERTRETEVGLDASYAGGVEIALTGYDKRTARATLAFTTTFPSNGGPTYAPLAGDVRNRGLEAGVRATLLRTDHFRWTATLDYAADASRVTDAVPLFYFAGGPASSTIGTLVREGQPVGVIGGRPLVGYHDLNGDGIISTAGCSSYYAPSGATCEFTVSDSVVPLGTPYPTRQGGLGSSLAIGRYVTLSGRLDYSGGMHLYDATLVSRCGSRANGRACNDPTTPLGTQAELAAARTGQAAGFVEDASFVKLRELAVALRLPARWTGPVGLATLTLAGRNLATFTDYPGPDPEVGLGQSPFVAVDYYAQPQVRTLVARLEIGR